MVKQWIGCVPENFLKGRPNGLKPEMIVLHTLDGSLADAEARYNRPAALMSVHYAVGSRGEINQYVDEQDTAYHAGLVVNPSASLVKSRPNTNPNFYTIGIGLEGKPGEPLTEAQLMASSTLIREIADRWNILLDNDHVVPHSAIRASQYCPGSGMDINNLLSNAVPNDHAQMIAGKEVVSLSNINVRSGASVTARILRVLAAGSKVKIADFVVGDVVKGNSYWYQDEEGNFFWAGATDRPDPYALLIDTDTDVNTDTMRLPASAVSAGVGIAINRVRFRLPAGQFYTERPKKDLIVLHFTAGTTAKSAFDTWVADPKHVAAAYIVDTDGVIYELFDPAQWAYHLGIEGTNGRHDKRSIAIEIVNAGPLQLSINDPNILNWWPHDFKTKFCKISEKDKYIQKTYRKMNYFAAFPNVQVVAVRDLLDDLCAHYAIPKHLPMADKHFERDLNYFDKYTGIASHANFRLDKWDIGPAFSWTDLGIPNSTQ